MVSIEELAQNLKPVRPAPAPLRLVLYWAVFCAIYVALALMIRKPGFAHTPLLYLGHLSLALLCAWAAFASASPHEFALSRRLVPLALLWPLPVIVSLPFQPSPAAAHLLSPLCFAATLVWSLPPLWAQQRLLRQGFVLDFSRSLLLGALAATSLGALAQNIACVNPGGLHRLLSHVLPVSLLSAALLLAHRKLAGYLYPRIEETPQPGAPHK